MKRLNEDEIKLIIDKIKKGESLNKISSSMDLYKSLVYYYYKKLKGKKYNEPIFKIRFSEVDGEIIGILTGDGSQHYAKINWNYQTNIHFGDNVGYVNYVKSLFENYFNKKWALYKGNTKDKHINYRLRVVDKKIFDYFSNYIKYNRHKKHDTVRLKTTDLPNHFKIGFLRGLIDTDGTICICDNRIRIMYYTTSNELAKQIKSLLEAFQIEIGLYKAIRKNRKDLYTIQVLKTSTDKFLKLIKPYKFKSKGLVAHR